MVMERHLRTDLEAPGDMTPELYTAMRIRLPPLSSGHKTGCIPKSNGLTGGTAL